MADTGFEILAEPLPDVLLIKTPRYDDERGIFLKGYHEDFFNSLPTPFKPAEQFISISQKEVLRGMHFQEGIMAHQKLVSCSAGRILDVVVDVRNDSAYFNKPISIELDSRSACALLIGKGYAHGFLALEELSATHYLTSSVHSSQHDKGILWSSFDFEWPTKSPIVSARDARQPLIGSDQCTFS